MATVIVTDGEHRAALAVVRSLGRQGHRVVVCSERRRSLAGASRYAERAVHMPAPGAEPHMFAERIARIVRDYVADVVLPITDVALLAILPIRARLLPAVVPWPDLDVVRAVADKEHVLEEACRIGIATPRQRVIRSPGGVGKVAGLTFPVVVKPSRSVVQEHGRQLQLRVAYANDEKVLSRLLAALPAAAYPVLVQERIHGSGVGVFLLLWDGTLVAACAHQRLREKPPSGGVSVLRASIPLDDGLLTRSRALLERFGWYGVAMLEYKVDAGSNTPYLMEANGRFWGSTQLAIDSGVDFPAMLVALARGERVTPVTSYRTGVRSRWWWGDVDQLLLVLRRSRAALALPPEAPGRWAALRAFLTPGGRRTSSEVLRWDDPRPFVRETLDWLARR